MKLFFLLSLLAMFLVHEGTSTNLETCDCHEIREINNATVQQAAAQLEYKQSLTINTAINNIKQDLESMESSLTSTINTAINNIKQDLESSLTSIMESSLTTMERLLKPIQTQLDYLLHPHNSQDSPATSCKELHELHPDAPSGYYWIAKSGSSVSVYCDMTRTCGDLTGGWMRVANIDMTDTSQQCPSEFTLTSSPKRVCDVSSSGSFASTSFSVHKMEYSRVCGRIIGYQYGRPIAFAYAQNPQHNTDISTYVYGVSLTHGQNPRKHIWTFAGASDEDTSYPASKCPCINTNLSSPPSIPSFVGSDYFCDTALTQYNGSRILHPSDPLWDGEGCGPTNTCCSDPNASVHPPWFIKDLPSRTSDDVEMRLCIAYGNGYAYFEIAELYVQ